MIALLLSDEVKAVSQLSAWLIEERILTLYGELAMGLCINNRQSSMAVMCLQRGSGAAMCNQWWSVSVQSARAISDQSQMESLFYCALVQERTHKATQGLEETKNKPLRRLRVVATFNLKWQNVFDEMHGFYESPVQILLWSLLSAP